nr:uncharacterized protein LOC127316079 [Lolium perenne]
MTIDEFMSVVPHWADNNKRAAFMELVKNWVGENPDFKAVSDRNKANRGSQGTHTAGSSSTDRYRERLGKKLGRELGEMEAWTHMKLVTPGPNEPRPAPEMYYGKAKENKERYSLLLCCACLHKSCCALLQRHGACSCCAKLLRYACAAAV